MLCQIIRDLVPPNEILTKVIKEFLAINQPHGDVIAMIVYQVSGSQRSSKVKVKVKVKTLSLSSALQAAVRGSE